MNKQELEALVKKHGKDKIRILEIPTDDSHKVMVETIVVIPSRRVVGNYMKFVDSNPVKAQEILIRGCVKENKEQIEEDDFMFNTTVSLLAELIPIGEGRIKKL